jgi:hypothetical protein
MLSVKFADKSCLVTAEKQPPFFHFRQRNTTPCLSIFYLAPLRLCVKQKGEVILCALLSDIRRKSSFFHFSPSIQMTDNQIFSLRLCVKQ